MSAQIRPNRLAINDRFPMLGFTIRTDGTPQRAEVTLATDPALFADPAGRTAANFFSTSELGPLSIPKGEAVYVVPPEVIARFIGNHRLYAALATAPAGNGGAYEVQVLPSDDSPYISISGLTGRSLRRVRMFPRRSRRGETNGYGAESGNRLAWAGDRPAPGMQRIAANGGNGAAAPNGNGRAKGNGANGVRATNGNGAPAVAPEAIDYDDGFGPLPAAQSPARAPGAGQPTAQAFDFGNVAMNQMQAVEPPSVSELGSVSSTAIQLALAANPLLTPIVVAARAAAELGDVSVGIGPAVSAGLWSGASLGVGVIFAPGNVMGVYGSVAQLQGTIASISATAQVTVVRGGLDGFRGVGYVAGFSVGTGIVGGGSVLFDGQRRFLGVSFQAGRGQSLSPLEIFTGVQQQVAEQLGHAAAFGATPARALDAEDIEIGEMAPVEAPEVSRLGTVLSTAAQAALAANPALTTMVLGARAASELGDVSIGMGPAVSGGFVAGAQLGAGIIFAPGNRLGVYGSAEAMLGAIASISLTAQVTVLKGGIDSFEGISYAAGFSAGEAIVGGASAIFDANRHFLGVSFQLGVGAGLSPLEIYTSVQRQVATELGYATAFGDVAPPAYAMVFDRDDLEQAQRHAPAWRDLFNWTVPSSVAAEVRRRGMSVQRIQDASGLLNLDRYEVRCTRLPNGYSAESLLSHIRRNMNRFVDTDNTEFNPYSSADRTKWSGGSPVGAIFELDIIGPDNAAVVGSMVEARRFRFTTVETPETGSHPVSGHREFGIHRDGDAQVVYTRGADRSTHGMGETIVFAGADHLWKSFQNKVADFVNDNGGAATIVPRFSERFHPRLVSILYGSSSSQGLARGMGAGGLDVEVKYRMFIPSPVVKGPPAMDDFGGDGRGFSYDGGSSRGEIKAVVHLSSGLGIDGIDVVDRHWSESTAYDSDDTHHVAGKPDWWLAKNRGARPTERAALAVDDDNLRIYAGTSGQRGIRVMAENASAVTVEAAGAMPLARLAPDIDADVSVLFRKRGGEIQVKALGRHDGFPAHELYVNGQAVYRYDPVAAGNGPSSLFGTGDVEVDSDWVTLTRTYPVQSQALGRRARTGALEFNESFTVNWDEVQSIPQPTDLSCWAAAGAMVVGWRDRMSLSPETIAEIGGRTTATGLDPSQVGDFADDLSLVPEPPQSYTKEAFRRLVENNGPLWVGAAVPSLHVVVVTGLYNDGPDLYLRITDPWDRAVGTPGAPGAYAKTHATGSRYIMKWEDFVAEYEAAATDYASVNLQILHSGGTGGRQPNRGASTPPGYAQGMARAFAAGRLAGIDFRRQPADAPAPAVEPLASPANGLPPLGARWQALAAEPLGAEAAARLAGLPALAAKQGWSIGVGTGTRGGPLGSGIGVTADGTLFRYGPPAANGSGNGNGNGAAPGRLLLSIVSGGIDDFGGWSRLTSFMSQDPTVPSGGVLQDDLDLPVGVSFLLRTGEVADVAAELPDVVDAIQTAYAARPQASAQGLGARAFSGDHVAPPSLPGLPGGEPGDFPPPDVRIFRSRTESNGVDYNLFLMDGRVSPEMPALVQQEPMPGEQVVVADWPYIDGPGGRSQGGVAINWSYGAGSVANVSVVPSGGQARDGWRVKVETEIGPGPSTPTEAKLKVTIRTSFARNGGPAQTGVSEVVLAGNGGHETTHREAAQAEMAVA